MGLYENHATDGKLEKTGVWVDYGEFRVKIAKAGGANRKYTAMVERETKPIRRALQAGTVSEERARPIMIKVFTETIIMGWQTWDDDAKDGEGEWVDGIEMRDGTVGKYTKENVTTVLNDLPAVFNMIKQDALADDIFKETVRQEEAGNS